MSRNRFRPWLEWLGVRAVPSADLAAVLPDADPGPAAVDPADPGGPMTVDMTAAVPVAPTGAY